MVDDFKRISEAREAMASRLTQDSQVRGEKPPIDKFQRMKAPRTKTERDLKGKALTTKVNSRLKQSASRDLSPLIFAQSLDPEEAKGVQ